MTSKFNKGLHAEIASGIAWSKNYKEQQDAKRNATPHKPMIPLHKFYSEYKRRMAESGEREGQAAFNQLSIMRKDLADTIRGTEYDPYYLTDTTGPRWDRFIMFIGNHW